MASLTGKVAIVTGASRGIGRAIATRLAQDGAKVIVHYGGSEAEAKEVVEEIRSQGGDAVVQHADIMLVEDIRDFFAEVQQRFGQIDIVVCNAGIAKSDAIAEVSEADYEEVFAINVRGVLFTLQEAALRVSENGRIIVVSSTVTLYPRPGMAVYAASKAAVKMFTTVLAQEVGDRHITVNSILPGATSPGMFDNVSDQMQAAYAASSPFGRIGEAKDIADVAAFLASEESRWITGQHIVVNGGATM
ncbi:glucose 1-dehydrogenase [Microcoleus sp. FACHB-1515]|uniref:glucose 1-dehydrogenase n=1 Tax=Cyanophyceae TaxID=3028117 RepID=UPI0016855DC9|nr:glucose 1-dehydrogenase [Microcoleus sp. FACHB-1515]MBD2088882.1 glucose 1-dehydrogenase [Microcoleus sp. FACHB-1515]